MLDVRERCMYVCVCVCVAAVIRALSMKSITVRISVRATETSHQGGKRQRDTERHTFSWTTSAYAFVSERPLTELAISRLTNASPLSPSYARRTRNVEAGESERLYRPATGPVEKREPRWFSGKLTSRLTDDKWRMIREKKKLAEYDNEKTIYWNTIWEKWYYKLSPFDVLQNKKYRSLTYRVQRRGINVSSVWQLFFLHSYILIKMNQHY